MAKVTFIDPIDTLSGKIAKRHCTTYYVRSAVITYNLALGLYRVYIVL